MPHELCIEEGRPTGAGGWIGWIEEGEEEEIQDGQTDGRTTTNSKEHVISLAQPESG